MADTTKFSSLEETNKKPEDRYQRWIEEIQLAEKESKDFITSGRTIYKRYTDDRDSGGNQNMKKFNVFSTNVGILKSSLFAKIPKVEVTRRFGQELDDIGRVAAMMIQNIVMQDMEDENCNFAQVVKYAITDWLVPGLGTAWLRLEAETEEKTLDAVTHPMTGEILQEEATYEEVTNQEVCLDYVHWDDLIVSPCRTWEERRWIGRMVYMDRDKLAKRFGEEKAKLVQLDYKPATDDDSPMNNIVDKAVVYEIWDRTEKKVIWITKGYKELLDEKDDPLELENFDPCPRPLFALQSTGNYLPRADYAMIQDQYSEMDEVNNRISMLVEACKVVGVYDESSASSIGRMLEEGGENKMIPVSNWAMFAEKGGVAGAIDWLPLDKIIQAIEKLRQQREDIKAQIYELTGISDIVRGDTKASETLGAQQIKAQFAGLRITDRQSSVELFSQEILNMKAQLVCKHFTPEQILLQSNFQYYLDINNQQLISEAISLIKGDEDKFSWRIKIDADSMASVDYNMQKEEKVQFTNAVATFLQSAGKLLEMEKDLAPIIFGTLKFAISGFKGARELEGMIDKTLEQIQQKMQNPEPPPPDPAMMKAQVDMQAKQQAAQLDAQGKQQDIQYNQAKNQQDLQFTAVKNNMELQVEAKKSQMDIIKKQTDMILDRKAKMGRPEGK